MAKMSVELDQQISSEVGDGHGTISIRVVVLTPKVAGDKGAQEPEPAADGPDDEPDDRADDSKGPLASYLEKKSYGKWCAVFLVNGQRHHAWDNTFISRDLGFKFLDRTMVVVDLDGLAVDAMSEIMQGSRQGLYEGKVYSAIRDRIIQTLKSNPELKRLQVEAEQKALDMRAGDAAVKSKLDQLIEGHLATAQPDGPNGPGDGPHTGVAGHFGDGQSNQPVVVMASADDGAAATLPALVAVPAVSSVRLHPGQSREVVITSLPREAWVTIEEFRAEVISEDENLTGSVVNNNGCAIATVSFAPTDYDDEDFPVLGELRAFARFKGQPEPRVLKRPVVVTKKPDPPEPIDLLDEPTFLRVRSRQPLRLVSGGQPVHVRMVWNGKPSLLRGSRPRWRFARCLTLSTFPQIAFGYMNDGRLTFILYPPGGMLTGGESLDFEVTADGPGGQQMRATFRAVVVDPPQPGQGDAEEPRRIVGDAPPTVGQRRPLYDLKYITQSEWANPSKPCFQGGGEWTGVDAGCFLEPTPTQPLLLLVINEDMELLKAYREGMVKRKPPLDPNTIKERTNKYISHIAFHLYQMFHEQVSQEATATSDDAAPAVRTEKDMRAEINRVGTTLMKMMEFAGPVSASATDEEAISMKKERSEYDRIRDVARRLYSPAWVRRHGGGNEAEATRRLADRFGFPGEETDMRSLCHLLCDYPDKAGFEFAVRAKEADGQRRLVDWLKDCEVDVDDALRSATKSDGVFIHECYPQAFYFLRDHAPRETRLVHGRVRVGVACITHAWLELPGGIVFDGVTQRFYGQAAYYERRGAVADRTYTEPEAWLMAGKHNHFGPWTD